MLKIFNLYSTEEQEFVFEGASIAEIKEFTFDIIKDRANSPYAEQGDTLTAEFKQIVEQGIGNLSLEKTVEVLEEWSFVLSSKNTFVTDYFNKVNRIIEDISNITLLNTNDVRFLVNYSLNVTETQPTMVALKKSALENLKLFLAEHDYVEVEPKAFKLPHANSGITLDTLTTDYPYYEFKNVHVLTNKLRLYGKNRPTAHTKWELLREDVYTSKEQLLTLLEEYTGQQQSSVSLWV